MPEASDARPARILLVEDDEAFARRMARNLALDSFAVEVAGGVAEALEFLASSRFDLVLTDLRMPGRGGLDLLDELARQSEAGEPAPPAVVLTSVGDIPTVVDAMRRGASDYITKEATREEIALRLRNVLRQGRLANEVRRLRHSLDRFGDFDDLVGQSAAIEELKRAVAEVAPSDVTVLVTGETGSGKELVARAIHRLSSRADGPFVELNCAALPDENLFLSELFGHERGAFTGALQRKRGQFELADGGTLFLDEVGELGPLAQARLLRAVETLQFARLGGEKPLKVNCRLIFATNRDLERAAKAGEFRSDLYYRIAVCPILAPPLRSHPEDIPALARFFAARMAEKHRLAPMSFSEDALDALRAYPWPGNVRELRNVVERMSIRFAGREATAAGMRALDLGGVATGGEGSGNAASPAASSAAILPEGGIALEEVERALVLQALQRADWNQRNAADLLRISVDRMNARVKKFGITHPSWRVHRT